VAENRFWRQFFQSLRGGLRDQRCRAVVAHNGEPAGGEALTLVLAHRQAADTPLDGVAIRWFVLGRLFYLDPIIRDDLQDLALFLALFAFRVRLLRALAVSCLLCGAGGV